MAAQRFEREWPLRSKPDLIVVEDAENLCRDELHKIRAIAHGIKGQLVFVADTRYWRSSRS